MKSAFDLNHQNENVESRIVASLERISQSFRVLLWDESKEHGLSPIQVQILIFLLHHSTEKRKVSYLASEFNMTKATISESVKTLEQKELIQKVSELNDTRSYVINLTAKGRSIADKASFFTRQLQVPIDQLDESEKQTMLSNLIDIIKHLNNVGLISIQRMCYSCRFFREGGKGEAHYCMLLNQHLMPSQIRIDCDEHEELRNAL